MASGSKYQIDMTRGPLFSKIVRFTLPLMMTNILQLLFHAADLIVIGQFAPGEALAAVGATSGLTVLVLNIFFGLGAGINVLVARYTGAKDKLNVSKTVHTAAAVALYWGVAMGIIGIFIFALHSAITAKHQQLIMELIHRLPKYLCYLCKLHLSHLLLHQRNNYLDLL